MVHPVSSKSFIRFEAIEAGPLVKKNSPISDSITHGKFGNCKDFYKNMKSIFLKFWLWLKTSLFGPAPLVTTKYVEFLERLYDQLEQMSFDPIAFQRLPTTLQLAIQGEFINLKAKTSYVEQMTTGGKDFKRAVDLLKTKYRLDHLHNCRKILRKDHIDLAHLHPNPYRKAYKMLPLCLQNEICFKAGKAYSERYKEEALAKLGKRLILEDPRNVLLPIVIKLISEEKSHEADLLINS